MSLEVEVLLPTQFGEFAESCFEDTFHRAGMVTVIDRALVEIVEVSARPEITLELLGFAARLLDRKPFHRNVYHDISETPASSAMTSCTTALAWRIRWRMERSWVTFI